MITQQHTEKTHQPATTSLFVVVTFGAQQHTTREQQFFHFKNIHSFLQTFHYMLHFAIVMKNGLQHEFDCAFA